MQGSDFRQICLAIALFAIVAPIALVAQQQLPNGQVITPTAASGATLQALNPHLDKLPFFTAGQAVTTVTAPDGQTLLVLTSGYNKNYDDDGDAHVYSGAVNNANYDDKGQLRPSNSYEYVFVFDISGGIPKETQKAIRVPNTFNGITFSPDGKQFYVSGGVDDSVHVYVRSESDHIWKEKADSPLPLGHLADGQCDQAGAKNGFIGGYGLQFHQKGNEESGDKSEKQCWMVAGIAITEDGRELITANYENDSISFVDTSTLKVTGDLDLRPGKQKIPSHGQAGGEFPYWVVAHGNKEVYVSSLRDREIDVVNLSGDSTIKRIPIADDVRTHTHSGNPNRMILNKAGTRLYVAVDNADEIVVIDTTAKKIIQSIKTIDVPGLFSGAIPKGADPNALAFSPDEKWLYVTNGGINALSIISVDGDKLSVKGLVPTGWYPNSVSVSSDGKNLYIVNGKSNTGSNRMHCRDVEEVSRASACPAGELGGQDNQYTLQLTKAGLLTLPVPDEAEMRTLTQRVSKNNGFHFALRPAEEALLRELRQKIKHVIYVVKENRSYDQILGDLSQGNGDPTLAQFPRLITPNQHRLAEQFVTLDNFFDSSNVSYDGWQWSTAARTVDATEKSYAVNYASRGLTRDSDGQDRGINVARGSLAERKQWNPDIPDDVDLLPGSRNEEDIDGPEDGQEGTGYLWDAAIRHGLTVRNYGFHYDRNPYYVKNKAGQSTSEWFVPLEKDPHGKSLRVAFPAHVSLASLTDEYYRGYDNKFPDFYRYQEWNREFTDFIKTGNLPRLTLITLMHDHTGDFKLATDGLNIPELQIADNDYALGLLVERVKNSPYAQNTVIFAIEDDAQDGPDHVDAHRSIAIVAGPYIKQKRVISERYTTVSVIRTIEELLGIHPQNLHDGGVRPMLEIFDPTQANWSFKSEPSAALCAKEVPFVKSACALKNQTRVKDTISFPHDASWWAEKTKDLDFSGPDLNDPEIYNRILWEGTMPGKSYPTERSGLDLRSGREALLRAVGAEGSQ